MPLCRYTVIYLASPLGVSGLEGFLQVGRGEGKNFCLFTPVNRYLFSMKGIALIIHLVLGAMLGTSHVLSYLIFIANTWDRITTPVLQMRRLGLRLGNFSKMAESGLDSKAQSGSQGKPRAWFLGRRSPCPALAVKRRPSG